MSVLHRVRAFAGQLILLAVLGALAAFLVSGPVRLANGHTDDGLRGDINKLPAASRDLTYSGVQSEGRPNKAAGAGRLDQIRGELPAPLPDMISGAWYIAETDLSSIRPAGVPAGECPNLVRVRWQTGTEGTVTMVDGRSPRSGTAPELMVGKDAAAALGLKVGDRVSLGSRDGVIEAAVVGVFTPVDPAAPIWSDQELLPGACPDPREGQRTEAVLLTDQRGAVALGEALFNLGERWRFRLDEQRITADRVDELTKAVAAARRLTPERTALQSSVDTTLSKFGEQVVAVQALLAVVQAGILATAAGLILLAARLMADRRRAEFALVRARGGAVRTVAGRTLRETLTVVPIAVLAGWLAGIVLPGRASAGEPLLVLAVLLVAVLAAPVYAALVAWHPAFSGHRSDVASLRPSPRRLTAEAFLVLLAAGGIFLLRRRGLDAGAGVDPYLITAPVLLAVAASVVALRLVPFPLRWAGNLAARARGAIAFLGLSGAGRAPLHSGPLAVLVVAIATGLFTGTVTSTVDAARDRAAELAVPADATVSGFRFAPDTAARIAGLPHVDRTTAMLLYQGATVRGDTTPLLTQTQAMVLDTATAGLDLPAALTAARPGGDAVPAIVSPRLAAQLGGGGRVEVQGREYRFTVAAVQANVPGLSSDARDFMVLPQQAMPIPDFQPILPNRILVAGDGFDPEQVRLAADDGQRAQLAALTGGEQKEGQLALPAVVTTRTAYRTSLEERGVDGALSFTFAAGMVAAAALALTAVALAVLTGAPARGRTLSRLRTMGLSARQGRRLLIYEILPLIGVAVLAGGLAGFVLPALIGPALGLGGFTSGVAAGITLDPWFAGGVLAVAAVAVLAALAVENVANRRLRVGTVLRLGEEQS
ncbi:putative ABC transport system permease protein [Actinoplanes octamycinicus]|uniref:Putative ABC transport system permease protein n=1 Tax=Actinoplanes octamycinicus TaxID=135948 RepID=A0A7W7M8E8_9ACTN|nr:FtsX-like permease family protein [Actinoplanes octamycinicus]MBB4740745.1 putative ABC transport system permease protein [Actinoplanes octamycinicus]GIE61717.1 membrane protein [Actinoplanes octamycinicus]